MGDASNSNTNFHQLSITLCSKDPEVQQKNLYFVTNSPFIFRSEKEMNNINCSRKKEETNGNQQTTANVTEDLLILSRKSHHSQISTSCSLKISDLLLHRLCSPAFGCSGTACECCIENPPQAARGTSGVTWRRPTYSGHNEERRALGAFSSVSCDGGGETIQSLIET